MIFFTWYLLRKAFPTILRERCRMASYWGAHIVQLTCLCCPSFLMYWGRNGLGFSAENIVTGQDVLESPQRTLGYGQNVLDSLHRMVMPRTSDTRIKHLHRGRHYSPDDRGARFPQKLGFSCPPVYQRLGLHFLAHPWVGFSDALKSWS